LYFLYLFDFVNFEKSIFMKSRILLFVFLFLILSAFEATAQRGKQGAKTVSAANTIVNEYTTLTAPVASGATTITVTASGLNANNRFSGSLAAGDLIMIIQVQGASISSGVQQLWWGQITNYSTCGLYEFAQVLTVPNSTTITVECPLTNSYSSAGKTEVVRVPRYTSLTINNGGILTGDTWDGSKGGILAVEVEGATVVNTGGSMDMTGKGFRGGAIQNNTSTALGIGEYYYMTNNYGSEKGEGIAGFQTDYDALGGRYCRGAPANGGGGGNAHNHGGGGGANAGDTSLWTGKGNPDISNAGWIQAWELESAGFSTSSSSGGGRGGYSFSDQNLNATTTGPWTPTNQITVWGGDYRRVWGGLGGRPLDYSTGRIFLGGGGGSGQENDAWGSAGANGGGIIVVQSYGTISGAGQIKSNGATAANSTSGNGLTSQGADGAGGGGAGGTIILKTEGGVSGITTIANGGNGGNQVISGLYSTSQAQGPGGGGGGGYIAITSGAITQTANGGANGTTNASAMTEFPPNGATKGGAGINNASVTTFWIIDTDDTICPGTSTTLFASLGGTPPPGTTLIWYDAIVGGNVLATGPSFTTPVLNTTTTYFVGSCTGTYHDSVTVYISNLTATASSDVSICNGASTNLSAGGGVSYAWSPALGLSNANIANPVASPSTTTTYVVTVTDAAGCSATADVVVTVSGNINASAGNDVSVCPGASTNLLATGGTTYSWSPATGLSNTTIANPVATPANTTTYIVTVTSAGCTDADTVIVIVFPTVNANAGNDTIICSSGSAQLHASGGTGYAWSPAAGLSSTSVSNPVATPSSQTTYTVTVTDANGCTDTDDVTVSISSNLIVTVNPSSATTCPGGSVQLTASGGTTYTWAPAAGLSATSGAIVIATPSASTTYTVTATNAGGCSGSTTVTVTIGANLTPTISGSLTICNGTSTTLDAGTGYAVYNWSTGAATQTISVSTAGTYTVSVSDAAGCSGTASATVTMGANLSPSISGILTICNGSSTTLDAGSGYANYNWSTGALTQAISVATAGNYSVTVSNAGGCSGSTSVTVTMSANLSPSITGLLSICNGASTTLDAGNGYANYNWSTGASTQTVSVSNAGTYTVTVSNVNGCSGSASVTVTLLSGPTVQIINTVDANCGSSDGSATVSGGVSYLWSNSQTGATASNLAAGTYTVTATDASGCTGSISVTINTSNNLSATATSTDENCGHSDGTATVVPAGTCTTGFTYQWSTLPVQTTTTATGLSGNTYTVTVSCGGCSTTVSVIVNNSPGPSAAITAWTEAGCGLNNGSATITASGGTLPYTYLWSNGQTSPTLINVAAGTYTITVTDAHGCQAVNTVTITSLPGPTSTISSSTNASCYLQNGAASVSVTGGSAPYTYSWNSTPVQTTQNLQNVPAGNYTVTVTDGGGCTSTSSVYLAQTGGMLLTSTSTNEDCGQANGTVTVVATMGTGTYNYTWSTNPPQSSSTVSGLGAGTYTVTVTDGVCTATTDVTVQSNPGPTAGFSAHPSIITQGGEVNFSDNSSGFIASWLWDFGDGSTHDTTQSPNHEFSNIGTFLVTLTVTDANGCTDTYSDTVVVHDIFTLYIPNSFSPNDDGTNDYFAPKGLNVDPDDYEMAVFDRWGNCIFRTTKWNSVSNQSEGWNGTVHNNGNVDEDIVMDVYVYRIRCKDLLGTKHQYIGRITLLP
jgi:gliding motility-associated-like protein